MKLELVKKSREAAMSAVQTFNNPLITFKSENFIVLMVIAWTYLLHAYYREQKVEYRYFRMSGGRRRFEKTREGAYRYWDLAKCLRSDKCPLDKATIRNLEFLIGLRHEIEHHRPPELDAYMSSRYQACTLNYCHYLRRLFGDTHAIEDQLAYAIQFSAITHEQITGNGSLKPEDLPENVRSYITEFDESLSDEEFQSERFGYRVYFFRKPVNRPGQADSVLEFVSPDSDLGRELETTVLAVQDREKPKFRPSTIVQMMHAEGFRRFKINKHTDLWRQYGVKGDPDKGYGTWVERQWYWYEKWVDVVREHCKANAASYS